jgi:hypothetical protein
MTQKRVASQHHATFQVIHRHLYDGRATSSHPLSNHIEDVLYMVQIITRI